VREALEETGLTVEARQVLGTRIHPATGREMHYVAFGVVAGTASIAGRRLPGAGLVPTGRKRGW